MFKAKTVMVDKVITVKKDMGIYDAIKTMVENNITGLPVVNDDMTLAGIITEKDVLKLLYNMEDRTNTVAHYMTCEVVCFDEEESLIDIAECFIAHHFRRVPILREGKVVGVISRKDIVGYILKLRRKDKAVAG